MRRYCLIAMALLLSVSGFSNENNYSVLAIPEPLLKNASMVKRSEEMRFEIISTGETVLYKKYALTILNESADEYAAFGEWYDKLCQIRSVEGSLYDAAGREIKRVKGKDIRDISGTDGGSLADDNRIKVHNFYYKVYPYTVEYAVELKFNHTFYFPDWTPQPFSHLSVQESHCTIIAPANYTVRYKSSNYKGEPTVATEKNKKILFWQVVNVAALSKPFAAPKWSDMTTSVSFAPSEFALGDYKGNMSDWKEFGKFIYALKKDRDQLPADIIQKVTQLTAGVKDDKEKVKILYDFLQRNTRYISIQLGIGGWQPFDAAFVAQKGYGDCKALSNYMFGLLKAAGIKSYYTLVNAGSDVKNRQMQVDFPSNQFNHVIVCVPLKNDTMWLECTNQSIPAGYMGDHTGNRKALLIDELGGTVVSTPGYGLNENLQLRSVSGVVNEAGNLEAKINTLYKGWQQEEKHAMLEYLSKEKVKKVLNEELNLSTYDINNFKYEEKKETLPEVNEYLDISVSKYATISGKRLFIAPNLLQHHSFKPDTAQRVFDYQFDYAYKDVDSVEMQIPAGYTLEAVPKDVALKSKFGSYSSSVKLVDNKLYYLRVQEQYAGKFPATDKEEVTRFFEAVYKADRSRVVLVKQ